MKTWILNLILGKYLKDATALVLKTLKGYKSALAMIAFLLVQIVRVTTGTEQEFIGGAVEVILKVLAGAMVDPSGVSQTLAAVFLVGLFDKLRAWCFEDGYLTPKERS